MTIQPAPLPKPKLTCACGAKADMLAAGKPVCPDCYDKADDAEIRIWRKSLTVVQGGLPC